MSPTGALVWWQFGRAARMQTMKNMRGARQERGCPPGAGSGNSFS